jgi:hypothetical protein
MAAKKEWSSVALRYAPGIHWRNCRKPHKNTSAGILLEYLPYDSQMHFCSSTSFINSLLYKILHEGN